MNFAAALLLGVLLAGPSSAVAGELKPFVGGSWSEIRDAARDKPVIVQFWGVTCAPCRVEMPEWGKLLAEHPDLRMLTIHAERAPPKLALIGELLKKAQLDEADNWYFADRFMDRLRFEIDPGWHGETPMTVLIGKDGTSRTMVGAADFAEIRRWLATERQSAIR